MADNQSVIAQIERACEEKPEKMQELLDQASEFDKKVEKAGIAMSSFRRKDLLFKALWKTLAAIVGLPYFIYSCLAALPMWGAAAYIRKGLKDPAFGNTVNLGVKLAGTLIWLPLLTLVMFLTTPWFIALPAVLAAIPSYSYFYDYQDFVRILISDCRLMGRKDLRREFKEIENSFIDLL